MTKINNGMQMSGWTLDNKDQVMIWEDMINVKLLIAKSPRGL